jgi:peroxiredoxin
VADEDVETTDSVDEVDEAEDDDGAEQAAPAPRRALDGRTLGICALIALIAALLAGFVTSRVTADDGDDAQQADLALAEEVPDLALPVLGSDDQEISLADYRGQPVVVNFWGSWCIPCVEEMPDFQAVHESLGDQVAFVGININDIEEKALAMAETTGVTYDLIVDADGELVRALEVTNFPSTFLVDADGTIVDAARRQVSAERLCEKINQSLLNRSLEECG